MIDQVQQCSSENPKQQWLKQDRCIFLPHCKQGLNTKLPRTAPVICNEKTQVPSILLQNSPQHLLHASTSGSIKAAQVQPSHPILGISKKEGGKKASPFLEISHISPLVRMQSYSHTQRQGKLENIVCILEEVYINNKERKAGYWETISSFCHKLQKYLRGSHLLFLVTAGPSSNECHLSK